MSRGTLYIVTAPSGCGKGTILAHSIEKHGFNFSVSATTRKPRDGEKDGVNYFFKTREEFDQMISENAFLEYAEFCGNCYGTPRAYVEGLLEEGKDVILEIEVQGAMNVIKMIPEAVSIFILPPSVNELRRRLLKRATEDIEVVEQRVLQAKNEIPYAKFFDYVIVNDDLEDALRDFDACAMAARFSGKSHKNEIENKILEVLENE